MIDIHNLVRSNKNKNFDAIASSDTAHAKNIHRRYDIGIPDDMLLDVCLACLAQLLCTGGHYCSFSKHFFSTTAAVAVRAV